MSAGLDIGAWREAFEPFVDAHPGPSWLYDRRRAALDRLEQRGMPTRRDEEWKYNPVGRFARDHFDPSPAIDADVSALVEGARFGDEAALVVFVAGRFDPALSSLGTHGDGALVRRLAEAWDDGVRDLLPDAAGIWGFDALRAAFLSDGVVVDLAVEVELASPIHVVHVAPPADAPWLSASTNVIRLRGHSKAMLVESFVGVEGAEYLACHGNRISLGDGATLDHVRIQSESLTAGHVATDDVVTGRDSTYRSFNFSLGSRMARDTMDVRVQGAGSHTEAVALYVPGDGQSIDNHTTIDHRAPHCTADQLYKGILDGDGHGVFNGKVFVRKAAQQTSAEQLNQNLMLSRDARIDTKPQLEIFADDVRCTHGATVGQIEAEELFYMMSRAIPESVARRMIVRGFADDALDRVCHPGALARMGALLDARLEEG